LVGSNTGMLTPVVLGSGLLPRPINPSPPPLSRQFL
jgi:hypothetical protein